MSQAAAIAFINEAVLDAYKNIKPEEKITTARKYLDRGIQSLNISYNVFSVNNANLDSNKLTSNELSQQYKIFYYLVKSRVVGVFKSYSLAAEAISNGILKRGAILVQDSRNLFLVGKNNEAISYIIKEVSYHPSLRTTSFGVRPKSIDPETGEISSFLRNLELGHTGSQTPFAETIRAVIKYTGEDDKYTLLRTELNNVLDNLSNIQTNLKYSYLNTSTNNKSGSAIINMVVQPYNINSKFSLDESKKYRQALNSIIKSLKLEDVPGSNTLKQDALQFVSDKLFNALSGKNVKNIKPHSKVENKLLLPSKPNNKVKIAAYKETLPQLRTNTSQFYSLTSLQSLINSQLQDVISANMGDGSQRNILNYRTGRFAGSAKVERLSQSREGMVTAFYSYMRNPYQTFEPGFRQGSPRTRDPKLLIAKSIREIAATRVANQLRSVSI